MSDIAQVGSRASVHRGSVAVARPYTRSVLHVFSYFRPDFTGEGLYLEKIASHLAALGVRSTVIAARTAPRTATSSSHYPNALGTPKLFGQDKAAISLPMLAWLALHAREYDVVHFHASVERYFLCHAIARLSGCRVPQFATLDDGLGTLIDGYRGAYRWAVRRLVRLIDTAVAISPKLYQDTLTVMPRDRVSLIPQGVALPDADPAARMQARHRWGYTPDDVVLLFVGGMCARKDVRFLVDHLPPCPPGATLRLLLVGPELDDAYPRALRAAIAASPAAARITVEGYMDDPAPAYRAADAFVFASRQEGFGNVLLEAMAFGLPVVCRRLPGVTDDFIDDGTTGLLFDTPGDFRDHVLRLAADSALRRSIGSAARRRVALCYDLRTVAGQYVAVYNGAASP